MTVPTGDSRGGDIFRIIIAILLPPLGVFLEVGLGVQFWINVLLTLFGYVPGIIHAVYIIATREIIPPGTLSVDEELAQLDFLADLLDSRFVIPGTNIRFGLDGLIGLIPGIGDVISALISLYLINRASHLGLSSWIKARMLANVAVDTVIGAVPLLGDAFDVGFKSNRRNIALVRKALGRQRTGKAVRL